MHVHVPALGVRVLLGFLALSAVAATPQAGLAEPARTAHRWHLENYHQSFCFSSTKTSSYYGVYIDGTWRHSIDVGAADLPQGGSYTTSYAPIPPGSSSGEYTLAYVRVDLRSNQPLGKYMATLWASDGRVWQSVPIGLLVQSSCGY